MSDPVPVLLVERPPLPVARNNTPVTKAIVLINGGVFVAMLANGVSATSPTTEQLVRWGADFGPLTLGGEWWRMLTCMFVHIGVIHIGFNMYVLWDGGRFLERMVGSAAFVLLYLITGLLGSLASLHWHPLVVSAGASGAVFGVYGALLGFLLPQRKVIPFQLMRPLLRGLVIFVGFNIAFGLAHPAIDNAAHIGGLVSGFFCGWLLTRAPGQPVSLARVVNMVVIGGAVIGMSIALIPRDVAEGDHAIPSMGAVDSYHQADDACVNADHESHDRYSALIKQLEDEEIGELYLADQMDEQVIGPISKARKALGATSPELPDRLKKRRDVLLRYMKAREQWYTLNRDRMREEDTIAADELRIRIEEIGEQIDKLVQELRR